MALATYTSFCTCLDAVDNASVAVQRGNAKQAANILKLVQSDANKLSREANKIKQRFQVIEKREREKDEILTSDINTAYKEKQDLERKKYDLTTKKGTLTRSKDSQEKSLKDARKSHQTAEHQRDEAQDKYDTYKTFRWVPVVNVFFVIREIVKDYEGLACCAQRDMDLFQSKLQESEIEIGKINEDIRKIEEDVSNCINKIHALQQQRSDRHTQREITKDESVLALEGCFYWEEVSTLIDNASSRTGSLEGLLRLAVKRNKWKLFRSREIKKILRGAGTKTIIRSCGDSWWEVREMLKNFVYPVED